MLNDEELYSRYLDGDNDAIDELLVRHKEGLIWFLFGVVHNMDDAEDLMMDTFALLLTKHLKFKNNSSFKTWLYSIGRNLASNYIRKKKSDLTDDIEQYELPESVTEGSTAFLEKERNNELYHALGKLPADYAEVLYLLYFAEMSVEEAAKVMKRSAKQIYNLTERAKNKLKELMNEYIYP